MVANLGNYGFRSTDAMNEGRRFQIKPYLRFDKDT